MFARRVCRKRPFRATLIKSPLTRCMRHLHMKQKTLPVATDQNAQYEQYRRPTKRDVFLATMDKIVPWGALCAVIEPHYPKAGNVRPPVGLERMLRMYFVQHWFNLADAACEDALLDSTALRRFVGIDLGRERVPDATTLSKFRPRPTCTTSTRCRSCCTDRRSSATATARTPRSRN